MGFDIWCEILVSVSQAGRSWTSDNDCIALPAPFGMSRRLSYGGGAWCEGAVFRPARCSLYAVDCSQLRQRLWRAFSMDELFAYLYWAFARLICYCTICPGGNWRNPQLSVGSDQCSLVSRSVVLPHSHSSPAPDRDAALRSAATTMSSLVAGTSSIVTARHVLRRNHNHSAHFALCRSRRASLWRHRADAGLKVCANDS